MQRSFTYLLLITWLFFAAACTSRYVQSAVESRNVSLSASSNPLDSQLVQIYLPYKEILEKDMSRVISRSGEVMVKDKPESNLTNFLADLLLEEGRLILQEEGNKTKPDMSYFNYGGIRTFLPEGDITVGKIFELMPFENELVLLQLTGKQVRRFLDHVAQKGGDSVGGVRFFIKEERAVHIQVNNRPLQPDSSYWLVTNDYVAEGGDGLEVFTESQSFMSMGQKIRDVIIAHLERKYQEGEVITARKDGRIRYE